MKCAVVGDSVKILSASYGWGSLKAGDIATVTQVKRNPRDETKIELWVSHPKQDVWVGYESDFEVLSLTNKFYISRLKSR